MYDLVSFSLIWKPDGGAGGRTGYTQLPLPAPGLQKPAGLSAAETSALLSVGLGVWSCCTKAAISFLFSLNSGKLH